MMAHNDENVWAQAPKSVVHLAQEMIQAHHPGLAEARIAILMRTQPTTSKGKLVLGHAEKVGDKWKTLIGDDYDFLIWLDDENWGRSDKQRRRAILDHELCHCEYDPAEQKAKIRGHDIEEFSAIAERYGAWNTALMEFQINLERSRSSQTAHTNETLQRKFDQFLPPRGEVVAVKPGSGAE